MKYYKKEVDGIVIRIDECEINPCDGEEISKEEYDSIYEDINKNVKPIDMEEFRKLFGEE